MISLIQTLIFKILKLATPMGKQKNLKICSQFKFLFLINVTPLKKTIKIFQVFFNQLMITNMILNLMDLQK
ncbi:hypothetical protein FGO68_gene6860 [Halteria grandinella]|uniref:Uncharacterized protein n=1 Tax=Halteria grandinella TaxID=5974 RepID=A0A8J8NBN0_HALGN|nr:hypothetical protein FGO68_gene6860 [Halteria grandinella]